VKVVKLSAVDTGRPYPSGNTCIPGTQFYWRLSRPRGHSVAVRIMSMKNSNDIIGNRTRDFLVCSSVPQPIAPPRASFKVMNDIFQDNSFLLLRGNFTMFSVVPSCRASEVCCSGIF
jgi:hypothetical protein